MRHGLNVHQYTDDTQLYLSVLSASVAVEHLDAWLVDIKAWLRPSRLRLNPTKTQVMWLGSGGQQLAKVDTDEVSLLASRVHVLDAARNLGVIFDSKLSMSAQISVVCRTGYCQLRQLRTFVRCLSEDATKILIQALINTWLDYCNSLYFGIADGLMSRLQSVQNAAARLITGARQCEHITPALRQLHWLPVRRRVDFKISALVYRSLAGTAPVYLADECTLVTALAAVLCGLLTIEQSNLVKRSHNQFGDRCFATAGERCGTVCLNSFGNRTSPSDNSNDR